MRELSSIRFKFYGARLSYVNGCFLLPNKKISKIVMQLIYRYSIYIRFYFSILLGFKAINLYMIEVYLNGYLFKTPTLSKQNATKDWIDKILHISSIFDTYLMHSLFDKECRKLLCLVFTMKQRNNNLSTNMNRNSNDIKNTLLFYNS